MRLPRRVPWASLAELDEVCSWIYADETDTNAQIYALNRLAAWRAITSLPHALECTHGLLSVIYQDSLQQGSTSFLSLRQSYAAAIIRLVNGLVDPLQMGVYARSINSIAAQLGLPAWFVELRHAATHEDLPSIDVLREAAREAMEWLLHNYFIPTLNPSTPAPVQRPPLRPLIPLLKEYKAYLKATTRDASLANKYKPEITRILREVERWVAEAKVAATGLKWDDGEEDDLRERWAMERLCDALLERGTLVPLSKKKRALSSSTLIPANPILHIWIPFLAHLQTLHLSLASTLVAQITTHLLSTDNTPQEKVDLDADTIMLDAENNKRDITYDRCLAAWANWLVDTYGVNADEDDLDDAQLVRDDVVVNLLVGLGPSRDQSNSEHKTARELLKALCKGRPALEKAAMLISTFSTNRTSSSQWQDDDIRLMHSRLTSLQSLPDDSPSTVTSTNATSSQGDAPTPPSEPELPPGWRRIGPSDGWKSSPIGVFVACSAAS